MSALLFLLLLQPEDADRWVEQLGDEDVAVRERAAQKLVEIGPVARPALEKAVRSGDTEVSIRIRTILGQIELVEQKRKSLGPAIRVTLPPGEHALSSIAASVKEQTGVDLRVPTDQRGARVRIESNSDPLLKFVDRLCLAHGGLCVAEGQTNGAIELASGTPRDGPVWYSGPFRIWLDSLRLERRDPYDFKIGRGSFMLGIGWPPTVRPIAPWYSYPRLTVQEMRGDDGKAILVNPDAHLPYSGILFGTIMNRSFFEYVPFEHPARGVRRLLMIRGHVDVLMPLKVEAVNFSKPLDSEDQERKAGKYTVVLEKCVCTAEEVVVNLCILEAPREEGVEIPDQGMRVEARFEPYAIELMGEDGKPHRPKAVMDIGCSGRHMDRPTLSYVKQFRYPADRKPEELRFLFVTECFEHRVEFEFRDVELP